jgi:hypothetical protein
MEEEQANNEKRNVGDWVTATIDGKAVSWINKYDGKSNPTPAPEWITATIDGKVVSWPNPAAAQQAKPTPAPAPAPASVPKPAAAPARPSPAAGPGGPPAPAKPATKNRVKASSDSIAKGDWAQVAYYNSEENTGHGVTFLNNMGGQGSGVFDMSVTRVRLLSI